MSETETTWELGGLYEPMDYEESEVLTCQIGQDTIKVVAHTNYQVKVIRPAGMGYSDGCLISTVSTFPTKEKALEGFVNEVNQRHGPKEQGA